MTSLHRVVRTARASGCTIALLALGACNGNANIGDILGGVLGGGPQNEVAGTIQGVDTRAQQIALRTSAGQDVALGYDANTRVIYQSQSYPVTALEYGDQVVARLQSTQGGGYYTDSVQVTQSVQGSGGATGGTGGASGNVQSLSGIVRQVDRTNGQFTIDANNGVYLTVSLPYNPRSADVQVFQNLRIGDQVRFYGVFLNNTRVELRQFY